MWQSRLVPAAAGGGGPPPRDTIDWHRFLVSATLVLFRIWLFPIVYLLERRRRSRRAPGRRSTRRSIIRRMIRFILRRIINLILQGLWGLRPATSESSNGSGGHIITPQSTAAAAIASAATDDVPVPEDAWVTAHNTNVLNSPLYHIPEEVLLQITESLDTPALYCFRQSCRRGLRLVAPDVVTANAPAPWEVETSCGRASGGGGGGGGGIRGGMAGGGGGVSSVLLGGRAAWGCAAEPPWQRNFVTARDLIGQALRRDLLCASCRDVRSGWERPLAVVNAVRRGVRCDGCSQADRRERHHPALLFSARMRAGAGRPPAEGRLCRGREGRIRLCAHVTIGWDQVEGAAKSAAKEQRRGDRRVTLRCMHKSHDFGGRVAEDELESKDGKDEWSSKKDWESRVEYQRRRLRMLREDTSRVWGHYPEVVVEPPPRGSAFGRKPDPAAREEKDAVASVLVRRMSAPFYFRTRPASVEELLRMMRRSGMHETIATCPHITFDDVVRRSFDPNVCACVGRGRVQVHHQHEEPDARCCMCHHIQTRGKESIFCDTIDPYVIPWGPDLSDDEAAATRPWHHQRPSRARHRPTRHGTSCNECLTEYWWMSNPSLSRIVRLISTTPDWGVDGPLDPRWLRLVDANCHGDGDSDHGGEGQDAEAQDPLTRNLLWCPSAGSNSGRQCAVARRGQAWGHGLERARHGVFELGNVYLNTGAIGTFLATLVYGGDRWEPAAARNRRRGGVGFLSQEMILGAV
ncbi:hypothetical protein RB601_006780 [Gaeumannomyces tritici]